MDGSAGRCPKGARQGPLGSSAERGERWRRHTPLPTGERDKWHLRAAPWRRRAAPVLCPTGCPHRPHGPGPRSNSALREETLSITTVSITQFQGQVQRLSRTEEAPGKGLPGSCAPPMHHPPRTLCHGSTCLLRMFARPGVCPGAASTGPAGAAAGTLDTGVDTTVPAVGKGEGEAAQERCSAAPGRREPFHRPPRDRERPSCPPEAAERLPGTVAPAAPQHTGCPAGGAPAGSGRAGMRRDPDRPRDPRCDAAPPVPSPAFPPSSRRLRAPPAAAVAHACAAVAVPGCGQSPAHTARPRREQVTSAAGWRVSPFKWLGALLLRLCFYSRR